MNETSQDLDELQQLLDRSIERAGDYLRSCLEMPEHSLKATQVARHLQGFRTAAVGTVTARGEPRVAPVGFIFYRAQFHIPTVRNAARAKHIAKRPGISLSYYDGNDLAMIVHGRGTIVEPGMPDFERLDRVLKDGTNGRGVLDWGEGIYIQIAADRFYTFARYPERFAL
jgi:hypothetical protein